MVVSLGCFLAKGGNDTQGQNCPLLVLDGEKAPCLKSSRLGRYYNAIKIFNLFKSKQVKMPPFSLQSPPLPAARGWQDTGYDKAQC